MSQAVEWLSQSGPRRRFIRALAIPFIAFVLGSILFAALNPPFWSTTSVQLLPSYLMLAAVWLAVMSETATRLAVDGPALRVHYLLGERQIPLNTVAAADLAPGSRPGLSVLRLARPPTRTFAVNLETGVAEAIASRLERAGLSVRRMSSA